jgi:hypothetical protein
MNNYPKEKLMSALKGVPISGLYENWAFTIHEIAQSVFKAQGQDMGGRTVVGYGGTVEEALQNCIKRAEIIDHPFRGFNILKLLAWKSVDIVGLLIRKIRGMTD